MRSRAATLKADASFQAPPGVTVDAFAGGRVEIVQFGDGRHRAGLEAALLASTIPSAFSGKVFDLGSGGGAVGMTIAARCPSAEVYLVDSDTSALGCAVAALQRPANAAFASRVHVVRGDIAAPSDDNLRADRDKADAVVVNPPFHASRRTSCSPRPERLAAHVLGASGLTPWVNCAGSLLRSGGQMVFVIATDLLAEILIALDGVAGATDILPIQPRDESPANRLLIRAVKGSHGTERLLPPLVLHDSSGGYLTAVDEILHGNLALSDVCGYWGARG